MRSASAGVLWRRGDGGLPSRPRALSGRDGAALARPRRQAQRSLAYLEQEKPCALCQAPVAMPTHPTRDGRGAEAPFLSPSSPQAGWRLAHRFRQPGNLGLCISIASLGDSDATSHVKSQLWHWAGFGQWAAVREAMLVGSIYT